MNENQLLRTEDVAKLLDLPRRRIQRLCQTNQIQFVKLGPRTYRFTLQQVQDYIQSQSLPVGGE